MWQTNIKQLTIQQALCLFPTYIFHFITHGLRGTKDSSNNASLLRYSGIGEFAMPQHKLYCKRVPSCTYFTFHDVIRSIIRVHSSRGSFISNRLWALPTSLCCILCLFMFLVLFVSLWVIWGLIWVICVICTYGRDPFVSFEVIFIEMYLCIVSLICGACWASAHCSAPISVSTVLRFNICKTN